MATWADVERIVAGLPAVTSKQSWGATMWCVGGKGFVWERPLRRADLAELGLAEQEGEVLGARVPDEGEKLALLAEDAAVFFTIRHLAGYPAVLVRLDRIGVERLTELITEAWLDRAPKRLARELLGGDPR